MGPISVELLMNRQVGVLFQVLGMLWRVWEQGQQEGSPLGGDAVSWV